MTSNEDRWMLEELNRKPGVRFCLVFTSDGLKQAHTDAIDKDEADLVAAACSGLLATARAVQDAAGCQGPLLQNFSQWSDGYLFVRHAGEGTCLAVRTSADVDPSLIAYEMAARIRQIGEPTLSTPARTPAHS
jgi:predicted regulator of Ras-like GTPase activity (Roadblock/LC7/MglB family)